MKEILEVTLRVTSIIEDLGIDYVVGGSIASSAHSRVRATQDVDIVADLRAEHVGPLVAALKDEFYLDESVIRDAVERRATFNVIHLRTLLKVDVFVAGPQPSTRRELQRRQRFRINDPAGEISIASPEDIVVQKLHWYRLGDHISERQWSDAMGVLAVRGKQLDLGYMHELANEMGVGDLLDRALREAGLGA